jgi:hypothetical protein
MIGMLDWVVVGGESVGNDGLVVNRARPLHPEWVRGLRDQCHTAGIPFMFKQWGNWAPSHIECIPGTHTGGGIFLLPDGSHGSQGDFWEGRAAAMDKVRKQAAGRLLDGIEHLEYPVTT